VAGRKLEAAVQELHALVELAEVHIAEAQVVEEIGIIGILAEELLQVDAGPRRGGRMRGAGGRGKGRPLRK